MVVKFLTETPFLIRELRRQAEKASGRKVSLEEVISTAVKYGQNKDALTCSIEKMLIDAGTPFFNVYPKVLEAIRRTSLSIKPDAIQKSVIHEMKSICIKLPIGSIDGGFDFIILTVCDEARMSYLGKNFNSMINTGGRPGLIVYSIGDNEGFTASCEMHHAFDDAIIPNDEGIMDTASPFVRIALGVMMLAADPDYIKPVLLKADEGKTTPIEERIARAKNRGVYGFTIGEDIERSPHFRRPHFGIRWTGKGGTIPKLVPIKGAIVGKEIMTTVPTGYETDHVAACGGCR